MAVLKHFEMKGVHIMAVLKRFEIKGVHIMADDKCGR